MAGRFWIAVWAARQIADNKTTHRQTRAGVIRLQSERYPNSKSEKPVEFEKLDCARRGMAARLSLGDSQSESTPGSAQLNLAGALKSVLPRPAKATPE